MPSFRLSRLIATLFALTSLVAHAAPWTYRGTLNDGGVPANGRYDIRLSLFDATGAKSLAYPLTFSGVEVKNGAFAVDVDFGIDLAQFGTLKLQTEVAQGDSGFVALGEPKAFDAKAALAGVCWDTSGNAGTNDAVDFLGTTDGEHLVFKVGNSHVMRFAPPNNVIGGSTANFAVSPGGSSQTIAGGGSTAANCGATGTEACANQVWANYGSIGGGGGNAVNTTFATIAGGNGNKVDGVAGAIAGGRSNLVTELYGAIAGGDGNGVHAAFGSIGGGHDNVVMGASSSIGGGLDNQTLDYASTVAGGEKNIASAIRATVSGGMRNTASGYASSVGGGENNSASAQSATVTGGFANCAGGEMSWAGGNQAKVRSGSDSGAPGSGCAGLPGTGTPGGDQGTFIWADSQLTDYVSTGPNQFLVRANGGVGINTARLGNHPNLRSAELTVRSINGDPNVDMNLMTANARGYSMAVVPDGGAGAGTFYLQELNAISTGEPTWTARLIITPSGQTQVQGGAVGTISDARLKKNIGDIERPLDTLLALRGHRFEYLDPARALGATGTRLGFVAQEVREVLPQWVSENGDGYYSVAPSGFEALTVEAMREQQALISAMQTRNGKLQRTVQALAERLAALETAKEQ